MRRLTREEKKQLGILIKYYRQAMYRSRIANRSDFTQRNFARGICSQAQLSRIENGEPVRDHELYGRLIHKLRLPFERLRYRDVHLFDELVKNLIEYQNRSDKVIHFEKAKIQLLHFQRLFQNNIIYLHYTYALELVLHVLHEDYDEANTLCELVEETLEILPPYLLIVTLQYLGKLYVYDQDELKAQMYFQLSLEHMLKKGIENPSIYLDLARNVIYLNQDIRAREYLIEAEASFHSDPLNLLMLDYYYSIIYAKEGDYDESIGNLINTLHRLEEYPYPIPRRKNKLIISLVIMYILNGDLFNAREVLNRVPESRQTDVNHFLLAYLDDNFQKYNLFQRHYKQLASFYQNKERSRERYFELNIAPHLFVYPYPLVLLILRDYYRYLKTNKKYKKALDLIEEYQVLNILLK